MQNNKRTNKIIYSIIAFFISTYCFNSHGSDNQTQNSLIKAYEEKHNKKDITPIEIIKKNHDFFFDYWEKLNKEYGANKETIDQVFVGILNSCLTKITFEEALRICNNDIFIKHIPKLDPDQFYCKMINYHRTSHQLLFYEFLESLSNKRNLATIKNIFKKIEDGSNGKNKVHYILTWHISPLPCIIKKLNLETIEFFVSKITEHCDYEDIVRILIMVGQKNGIIYHILNKNASPRNKIKILESIKGLLEKVSGNYNVLKNTARIQFKSTNVLTKAINLNNAEILYHLCDIYKNLLKKHVQEIFDTTNNKENFDTIKEILENNENIEITKKETIYKFLQKLDEKAFHETFPDCENKTKKESFLKEEYKNILIKNVTISDKIRSWLPAASSALAAIISEVFTNNSKEKYVAQHDKKPIISVNSLAAGFFANISSRMFNYVTNTPKIKTNKILNISSMTSNIALSTLIGLYTTKKMSIQRKAFSHTSNKKLKSASGLKSQGTPRKVYLKRFFTDLVV